MPGEGRERASETAYRRSAAPKALTLIGGTAPGPGRPSLKSRCALRRRFSPLTTHRSPLTAFDIWRSPFSAVGIPGSAGGRRLRPL
jgi:hypothetical protein